MQDQNEISSKIDVVIPLGVNTKWFNEELRYTLRSFDKYFKNLGNVYIVGSSIYINKRIPWLTNVIIVECDDPFVHSKDANMIRKVLKVINNYPELSENFIRGSDDQILMKEVSEMTPYYVVDMKTRDDEWWRRRSNKWKLRLRRTYKILSAYNYTTFNYETHIPMIVNKQKFKEIWSKYPWAKSIGYTINSIYFNRALQEHFPVGELKYTFETPVIDIAEIKKIIKDKTYISFNDRGLTEELKTVIQNKFKKFSIFEK